MPPEFDHVIRANEYGFLCLPNAYLDRDIGEILYAGSVYEPATLRFLRRQMGQGDVVSGGAFVGDFLPALHDSLAPGARIHSFEPTPTSFRAALETVRLNGLDRVTMHAVAVGETASTLPLRIKRRGSGQAIAAGEQIRPKEQIDEDKVIAVPVVPIDTLVPQDRRGSLLHLDVEGFEEQALRGATRVLAQRPLVVCEAGKRWRQRSLERVLKALAPDADYALSGVIEHNAVYRPMSA